jgi:hypothetical protein
MKTVLLLVVLACTAAVVPARAQDVRVTISGEVAPGVYGRVDIGSRPPPLVFPNAVLIRKHPNPQGPIYMHGPPGHARNWAKHCSKYNACGRPVYFVRSAEYESGYRPGAKGPGKGAAKAAGKGRN